MRSVRRLSCAARGYGHRVTVTSGSPQEQELLDDLTDFRIDDDHDGDPVLLRPDGTPVDTWRENYPYQDRLPRPVAAVA